MKGVVMRGNIAGFSFHIFLHGDAPERADAYERIYAWLDKYLKAAP
jgi:hypothetical protein